MICISDIFIKISVLSYASVPMAIMAFLAKIVTLDIIEVKKINLGQFVYHVPVIIILKHAIR